MKPVSKRNMFARIAAGDVKRFGIVEYLFVMIGRTKRKQDLTILGNGYTTDLDL